MSIWTDGGPKHFKTSAALYFNLVTLKLRMENLQRIEWNFFASYHGKSACDGHTAYVKSTLVRLALGGVDAGATRPIHSI